MGPGRAGANSLLRHRKREQLLVTPQPLLCHPPPHPQEGKHHTLSANQSLAPPSHHIIWVSKVTGHPVLSLSLSLSILLLLFPSGKVPHHRPLPSPPSIPLSHSELVLVSISPVPVSNVPALSLSPPPHPSLSAVGLPLQQRHLPHSFPRSLTLSLHPLASNAQEEEMDWSRKRRGMRYVLLCNLPSDASAPEREVSVPVCAEPNPSCTADLMSCLMLVLAWLMWGREEADEERCRSREGGDSQCLLWAFVMEACSAEGTCCACCIQKEASTSSLLPVFCLLHTELLCHFTGLLLFLWCVVWGNLPLPEVFLMCFFPSELWGDLGRWSNFATALKQTGKSTSAVLRRYKVYLQIFQIVKTRPRWRICEICLDGVQHGHVKRAGKRSRYGYLGKPCQWDRLHSSRTLSYKCCFSRDHMGVKIVICSRWLIDITETGVLKLDEHVCFKVPGLYLVASIS